MKKQLLFIFALLLMAGNAFSQATAYNVPNLQLCNSEVFDLTVQTPIVLGNQNPDGFNVEYYGSLANANNGLNAITTPSFYVAQGNSQTIYVRVQNITDNSFDVTSFTISWSSITVDSRSNVEACGMYILPPLQSGSYYRSPNGIDPITTGTVITSSQYIYIYAGNQNCWAESSFSVTIVAPPVLNPIADITVCDSYTLPPLTVGNYFSNPGGPNGSGMILPAGTAITQSTTIYVYAATQGRVICTAEDSFTVIITGGYNFTFEPLTACDDNADGSALFDLTPVVSQVQGSVFAEVTFYHNENDAMVINSPITNISSFESGSTTIYVRTQGIGCSGIFPLILNAIECNDNIISGTLTYDYNTNGCDANDYPAANVQVSYTNGNNVYSTFTNIQGNYTFVNVPDGENIVYVQPTEGQGFIPSPAQDIISMPGDGAGTNFCLTMPVVNDVAVYLWASNAAIPGFNASYYVSYQNFGTTSASGTITIQYDNTKLVYVPVQGSGITQSGNTLTLNYTGLAPFSSQWSYISFIVAQPPVANLNDHLVFTANITPSVGDVTPENNTYILYQTVVNSYDPNDIAVNRETIALADADDYLYYTIRFQNMGTANATNVRIASELDNNLDWETFKPVGASHNYVTNRTGRGVEFLFNNIQLPYESANEAASHGSVTYKVKPKANIGLGDVMEAQAAIFFDFNEAIITNTAATTVEEIAGFKDASVKSFMLYPNPAWGAVTLQLNSVIANETAVTITDVLGKTVLGQTITGTQATLNIASLKSGVYFVTLKAAGKQSTQKLVIK